MPVTTLNPPSLPPSDVYRQIGVATGTRTVYISGQVARTADGTAVGAGDLAAQVEQAFRNVGAALEAVGGTSTTWPGSRSTSSTGRRTSSPTWVPVCSARPATWWATCGGRR